MAFSSRHSLARNASPALVHGSKLDGRRPSSLGVCERIKCSLVKRNDSAIGCSELYEFLVVFLHRCRKGEREEEEAKKGAEQHHSED